MLFLDAGVMQEKWDSCKAGRRLIRYIYDFVMFIILIMWTSFFHKPSFDEPSFIV